MKSKNILNNIYGVLPTEPRREDIAKKLGLYSTINTFLDFFDNYVYWGTDSIIYKKELD